MRYLSLFDGIGAASCAWESLGWECVGVSEIEPFPIAVTTYHRPHVPHLGDITKITEDSIKSLGRIDLIVGGFPCQDLSVAGKRAGLRNEDGTKTRSGLFFDAMRIVRWARQHCGLRWVLIENVPGLYSSNKGKDFAAVVGEVVGTKFDVSGDGWRNAGVAIGPEGLCEWTTLDAQYVRVDTHPRAVPQRRRRCFLVGDFGDWASREPLFLIPESMCGHLAPRRETGKGIAPTVTRGAGSGGTIGQDDGMMAVAKAMMIDSVSPCLDAMMDKKWGSNQWVDSGQFVFCASDGQKNATICENLAPTLVKQSEQPYVTHSLRGEGFDADEDGTGRGTPLMPVAYAMNATMIGRQDHNGPNGKGWYEEVVPTQTKSDVHAVSFAHQGGGAQTTLGYDPESGICQTLGANQTPAIAGMSVRRLLPVECEKLQGFPPGYTDIKPRGKDTPDGPRYKALGNSMAVPVMRWIGQRIQQVEDI